LLTAVAGGLVTVGVAEPDAADFVATAEPVVGGVLLYAIAQVWSIFEKKL
jgi:uncharacterized membrane protein